VEKNDYWQIRRLQQTDVWELLEVISGVRRELGIATHVASLLEPNDYAMLDVYRHRRSAYFVAVTNIHVWGGAGIFPLANGDWSTCELQRIYLHPQQRRRGIGQGLLSACLETARSFGFERCYAETISGMSTAIAFYEHNGFRRLSTPISEIRHNHNDYWLMLSLGSANGYI